MADISASAQKTASASEEAGQFVGQAGAQLGTSMEYVKDLNTAMEKISSSSEEIGKIIATIENIAFQTNILALNAAIILLISSLYMGFSLAFEIILNLTGKLLIQDGKVSTDFFPGVLFV